MYYYDKFGLKDVFSKCKSICKSLNSCLQQKLSYICCKNKRGNEFSILRLNKFIHTINT